MATPRERLPENAPGPWFVDASCIDCDACRQIAPRTFARSTEREQSFVVQQPVGAATARRAAMALVACPTSSIGARPKVDLTEAIQAFPEEIAPSIYYCGFASESSFGASSYLIRRPNGQNVLVDSPRAAKPLLSRIREMGGVATMLLTHADDVADHAVFAHRFGARRIMHEADASHSTRDVEVKLRGEAPVRLDDDWVAIPVPGHTRGSTAFLYRDEILFTGDHLWWSGTAKRLAASRSVCWYSWDEQTRSMQRLLDFSFERILPGHGRPFRASSPAAMRLEIERVVASMRRSG
jgi:glyoxylase-like metal-dependent hydrolase (beta-lactamase superfamily II)/ferredoxin